MPIPFGLPPEPEVLPGGGGLYSTAGDYGRFLRMLMGSGPQLLSEATLRELATLQTAPGVGGFKSALPGMSHDYDPYPGMPTGYGLATLITPDPTGDGRRGGSLTWAGLANTYYWADPVDGRGGVLMTQLLPFADPEVLELFKALERDAYGV